LKADFVDHVNIPLRSKYLPKQKLLKKWCLRNVGAEDWDGKNIFLKFTKGHADLPTKSSFPVPVCKSGNLCELSAMIFTPETPGRYTAYFRLMKGETFFGPRIWVDIHVVENEEDLTKEDEQTQKRLERFEQRHAQQQQSNRIRESPVKQGIRHSQRKKASPARATTRRGKKEDRSSGLSLVQVPVVSQSERRVANVLKHDPAKHLNSPQLSISVTDISRRKKPAAFAEQLQELKNMGFNKEEDSVLSSLLRQHNGDINRVVETILSRQQK